MIAHHEVAVQWLFAIVKEVTSTWELSKNNVDSSAVRCLALAVLWQHVAVALALQIVALVLAFEGHGLGNITEPVTW